MQDYQGYTRPDVPDSFFYGTHDDFSVKQVVLTSLRTAEAARLLAKAAHADLYEIRPERPYTDTLQSIRAELEMPIDKHSQTILVDRIKLILDYYQRFYDRQFITRHNINSDILSAFEQNIRAYFETVAAATADTHHRHLRRERKPQRHERSVILHAPTARAIRRDGKPWLGRRQNKTFGKIPRFGKRQNKTFVKFRSSENVKT